MLNSDKPRAIDPDRQLIRCPEHEVDHRDSLSVSDSRLWGANGDPLENMFMQWLNENEKVFSNDTFVDGSGMVVREDDALSQGGFSVVSVVRKDDDATVDASENPDGVSVCGCRNQRNPFHACSDHCIEYVNCTGICLAKKPEQKLVMATPLQAAYGPLPGNTQTTRTG